MADMGHPKVEKRADSFDWHSDQITENTPVTGSYRNTQNVRRFMRQHCGPDFKFDREFMAWVKNGQPKTMGEVAMEWKRQKNC